MMVRFKFPSVKDAETVAMLLPCACKWSILRDRTSDAYLEVSEDYEDYVNRYLYHVTVVNSKGNRHVTVVNQGGNQKGGVL